MTQFWVGGYGADMDGSANGIGTLSGDEGREPLTLAYRAVAARAASPSWLAQHPSLDIVYAALEGAGTVQAFTRSGESTLARLGRPADAGALVCHIAVAPDGSFLIASCYGDGRVVRIGLDADGRMLAPKVAPAATDPYATNAPAPEYVGGMLFGVASNTEFSAAAQLFAALAAGESDTDVADEDVEADAAASADRSSHAHAAAFLPDGRIATTDLGFDLVRIWRRGPAGLIPDHEVVLPFGVGPRHMVVHPSGHLHVVTESSCEIFTLAMQPNGRWAIVSATLSSPAVRVGTDFPAELVRTRDGAFLYTALRGSNTVAALRVRGAGESLESVALADSGVDWPRHHLIHDGVLLIAGQRSDQISVLDLDERTGAPRSIRHRTSAPAPTHLLLAR